MGEPTPISLGFQTNPARNQQAGNAQLINCFAEEIGQDGKVTIVLYATEGLEAFGDPLAGGGIRAMIDVDGTLFVIAGRNVYAVSTGGAANLIGGIPTDGPVYLARNRAIPAQIGLVSDGLYFVINTGAYSVTQILDIDLPSPLAFDTLNGYGVIPVIGGSYFLTGIDQFETIDGLDEGSCESYPDELVRNIALENEMVFLGTTSIEWHQDTGAADFPFSKVHALELGCLSGPSVSKVDTAGSKTIIWVAPDHTVRQMQGYSAQVISTNEIEKLIAELHRAGNIAQLKAYSWAAEGRFRYVLTCDGWTRAYDSKSGRWATRKSYELDRWRISAVVPFGNKLIAGNYLTGQLYEMSSDFFSEDGQYKVMEVITPTISAFPYGISVNRLYIDAATGVGLNTPDTAHTFDPKIMVSLSKDGGYSWGAERERSLGKLAQTFRRVPRINRLGRASDKGFALRLRISAPVEQVMIQMAAEYDLLKA